MLRVSFTFIFSDFHIFLGIKIKNFYMVSTLYFADTYLWLVVLIEANTEEIRPDCDDVC